MHFCYVIIGFFCLLLSKFFVSKDFFNCRNELVNIVPAVTVTFTNVFSIFGDKSVWILI